MESIFEQMGVTYKQVGDYLYPDIELPEQEKYDIGRFGQMRCNYLKEYKKGFYSVLLTTGKLNSHLHEIDETAYNRMELLSKQIAEREGVTEKLKAENQMLWVQKYNNIRNRIEEIIREELIYA